MFVCWLVVWFVCLVICRLGWLFVGLAVCWFVGSLVRLFVILVRLFVDSFARYSCVHSFVGLMACSFACLVVCWLIGWLVGLCVCWLVCLFDGWLVNWLVGWFVCLFVC